jgi:hypothetical protein
VGIGWTPHRSKGTGAVAVDPVGADRGGVAAFPVEASMMRDLAVFGQQHHLPGQVDLEVGPRAYPAYLAYDRPVERGVGVGSDDAVAGQAIDLLERDHRVLRADTEGSVDRADVVAKLGQTGLELHDRVAAASRRGRSGGVIPSSPAASLRPRGILLWFAESP